MSADDIKWLSGRVADLAADARESATHVAALVAVLRHARPFARDGSDLAQAIAAADSMDYSDASDTAVFEITLNGDRVLCTRWSVSGGWVDVPLRPFRSIGGRVPTERLFGVVAEHFPEDT